MSESFDKAQPASRKQQLIAQWNKRLESEGMPAELDHVQERPVKKAHSPAYNRGIMDLATFFIEHERANEASVHIQKAMEIKEQMRSNGATPEELEVISPDFIREVEDVMDSIQLEAQTVAQTLAAERPILLDKIGPFSTLIYNHLMQDPPALVTKEALRIVALRAAEAVGRRG